MVLESMYTTHRKAVLILLMAITMMASLSSNVVAQSQEKTDLRSEPIMERLAELINKRDEAEAKEGIGNNGLMAGPEHWISPKGLSGSLQILSLLTVLSLAPALLLMTTCYVRVIVVFGLLKQAMGTAQLPPSQVITSISLFITLFVMTPVWNKVYVDAVKPYTTEGSQMTAEQAWDNGVKPVREFMMNQIIMADNYDDVAMFYSKYKPDSAAPEYVDEVPLQVLLPAYMLSELKTAFIMGFAIYLPFLILDIVIASITISMGMMMLPPAIISTPFKLLLFVLVDGWRLVVNMLIDSFGTFGT